MEKNEISVEEFIQLKNELLQKLEEIKGLKPYHDLKWIRTKEVCKILGLSNSSVQNLRNTGDLPFTKVRGSIFYKLEDVKNLLEENYKRNPR